MHFPISNRAFLQGMMASAVALAGATACSRADRNDTGRDNTAAVLPDTAGTETTPSAGAGTSASGAVTDTGTATGAISDTATATVRSNTPRARTAPAESNGDSVASGNKEDPTAGYREMEGDSARVTADTSETSMSPADTASVETAGATSDTSTAGYVEMARDTTSTTPEQADTASAEGDVTLKATVDTTQGDVEVAAEPEVTTDTLVVAAGDSTQVATSGDRPPEDSTEVLGNDEVGAAAIGGNVTGSEAVSLTTRQGTRCLVVDPESNEAVRWDMSSTPSTLNPCGMGSMVLSRIWTER